MISIFLLVLLLQNRNQCLCKKCWKHHWFIYPMQHEGTNLTGFSMILPEKGDLSQIIDVFLNKQPKNMLYIVMSKGMRLF